MIVYHDSMTATRETMKSVYARLASQARGCLDSPYGADHSVESLWSAYGYARGYVSKVAAMTGGQIQCPARPEMLGRPLEYARMIHVANLDAEEACRRKPQHEVLALASEMLEPLATIERRLIDLGITILAGPRLAMALKWQKAEDRRAARESGSRNGVANKIPDDELRQIAATFWPRGLMLAIRRERSHMNIAAREIMAVLLRSSGACVHYSSTDIARLWGRSPSAHSSVLNSHQRGLKMLEGEPKMEDAKGLYRDYCVTKDRAYAGRGSDLLDELLSVYAADRGTP